MFDWIFAFVHLILLLGLLGYSLYTLVIGKTGRGLFLLFLLGLYYVLVLHRAVKKEIARRRSRARP